MVERPLAPIRIVPLRTEALAPVTTPQLTYRGGPLLAAVEVFVLFWGDAWRAGPQADLTGRLNDFFDFVLTSPLQDQMSEYSVDAYAIGHGKRTGSTVAGGAPPATVTDADVRAFLRGQIAAGGTVPRPSANTLYFVFLPPGVTSDLGGASSCVNFCGYHDDDGGTYYAVLPYPGCDGCTGGLSELDALTTTTSHELCEAVTDPVPGTGWYDDSNGEIGDICAWQTKPLGAYTVQLEWSNAQRKCV